MPTPSDIVTYLASLKGAHIVRVVPRYVTVGRQTYPAARYTERLQTPPGSAAYQRGERTYEREMIYCVGFLPSAKVRGNVAFTVDDDSRDWFVAGYYGDVVRRKQKTATPSEFRPFGNSFLLAPWDSPDGTKIDTYARVPYRRVKMSIGL